jgi:DNA-binding GntR family transcriptional regulator
MAAQADSTAARLTKALPAPSLTRSRQTLTDEVKTAITNDLIVSEAIPAGGRLPTEAELCARYGVSRVTIRAALRSLQDAGYINIRQGLGSTVLPRPDTITSGIDQLCSFETFAELNGQTVGSTDVEIEEIPLDDTAATRLGVAPGTRALVIQRVKLIGDAKVGWIVDYVPQHVLPFSTIAEEFSGSVLDVLLAHGELEVDHSDCELTPVSLDEDIAHRLDAEPGSAALVFDELTRTKSGAIVNWSKAWLLPEHFKFVVRRR